MNSAVSDDQRRRDDGLLAVRCAVPGLVLCAPASGMPMITSNSATSRSDRARHDQRAEYRRITVTSAAMIAGATAPPK